MGIESFGPGRPQVIPTLIIVVRVGNLELSRDRELDSQRTVVKVTLIKPTSFPGSGNKKGIMSRKYTDKHNPTLSAVRLEEALDRAEKYKRLKEGQDRAEKYKELKERRRRQASQP